jgi:peptide deformylase
MALLEIITPANPVLRQKARKVSTFSPELKTLTDDMIETMRVAPGVGLAAPQIAIGLRIVVIEYADEPEEGDETAEPVKPKLFRLINPEIVKASDELVSGAEGCLSIPGYAGDVMRHQWVHVKAQNLQGKPVKIKADGWLARIFQHEIDHLDGVLFIDKATRIWKTEPAQEEG